MSIVRAALLSIVLVAFGLAAAVLLLYAALVLLQSASSVLHLAARVGIDAEVVLAWAVYGLMLPLVLGVAGAALGLVARVAARRLLSLSARSAR